MYRDIALLDQLDDGCQAIIVRHPDGSLYIETELGQPYYIGKVQILKIVIVGNVEKDPWSSPRSSHLDPYFAAARALEDFIRPEEAFFTLEFFVATG